LVKSYVAWVLVLVLILAWYWYWDEKNIEYWYWYCIGISREVLVLVLDWKSGIAAALDFINLETLYKSFKTWDLEELKQREEQVAQLQRDLQRQHGCERTGQWVVEPNRFLPNLCRPIQLHCHT
jgi:hypothetical protein